MAMTPQKKASIPSAQWEKVLQSLPVGVTIQNTAGEVVYTNKKTLSMVRSKSFKHLKEQISSGDISHIEMYNEEGRRIEMKDLPGRRALQTGKEQTELVRYVFGPGIPAKWSLIKAVPLRDANKEVVGVINSVIDLTELKNSQESLKILNKIVRSMARSWGYYERFQKLTELIVPEFADWCAIDILDKKKKLMRVAFAVGDKGYIPLQNIKIPERYMEEALESGDPVSYSDEKKDIHSSIIIPFSIKRKRQGTLTFVYSQSGRQYTSNDIALLKSLTQHAEILAENAKLLDATQERLIKERHIKDELQQSHETLRVALEAGKMGLWELDIPSYAIKWSQSRNIAQGGSTSSLSEDSTLADVMSTIYPEDRALVKTAIEKSIKNNTHLECEFRVVNKKGNVHWIRTKGSIVGNVMGKTERMIGIHMDVTNEKAAQTKLEESEKEFKAIFNSALDAIIIYDKKGTIISVNDSASNLFNMSQRTLTRTSIKTLLPKIPAGRRGELQLATPINGVTTLEYTQTKSFIPNTNVIFLRDMTDRIIEQKRREHFLDIAGHEIKTPLASIKAYVQILHKKAQPEMRDYLKKIDDKTNMVTRLINELMDVTRIRQGRLNFVYEICRFDELVEDVRKDFSLTYPSHKVVTKGKSTGDIILDKGRIIQVMNNLIKNAIRYSPDKDVITLELSGDKNSVTLKVIDQGIGILPENVSKIFDLYFRSPRGENTAPGGLGVGLFISSQIVRRHGGSISVTSTAGKGSTFVVTLPRMPKEAKHAKKSTAR